MHQRTHVFPLHADPMLNVKIEMVYLLALVCPIITVPHQIVDPNVLSIQIVLVTKLVCEINALIPVLARVVKMLSVT